MYGNRFLDMTITASKEEIFILEILESSIAHLIKCLNQKITSLLLVQIYIAILK